MNYVVNLNLNMWLEEVIVFVRQHINIKSLFIFTSMNTLEHCVVYCVS
jgi:hypothetical protein